MHFRVGPTSMANMDSRRLGRFTVLWMRFCSKSTYSVTYSHFHDSGFLQGYTAADVDLLCMFRSILLLSMVESKHLPFTATYLRFRKRQWF